MSRRDLFVTYCALSSVTLVAAAAVTLSPGAAAAVRAWLAADLSGNGNPPPEPQLALALAVHNIRVFGIPFALAAGRIGQTRLRRVADVCLGLDFGAQAALVGAALGAYGGSIAPFLVHVPFEWAGPAVAGSVWMASRRRSLVPSELVVAAAVFALVLTAAAALEVYATPHR